MTEIAEELHPSPDNGPTMTNNDTTARPPTGDTTTTPTPEPQQSQPETFDIAGRLPTIQEDDAEYDEDALITEDFYEELISDETIDDDPEYEDMLLCMHPVEMTPDSTVIFTCNVAPCHEHGSCVGVPYVTRQAYTNAGTFADHSTTRWQ